MSKYTNIRVLVARSQEAFETGCDDCRDCDTIGEAKKFARYSLTEAYRQSGEFSEPMNCARVMAQEDGRDVCVEEYWRKGWQPAPVVEIETE